MNNWLCCNATHALNVACVNEWKRSPTLSGGHVRLEPLTPAHADGLYKAGADPAIWYWLRESRPHDLAGMREIVRASLADGSRVVWAQIDTRTGEVAGTTSYYQVDAQNRALTIGYTWIGRPWQRTPLNTEAKFLLLRRAFDTLAANRVAWETDIFNERSQRAIERLGARREGVLRAHRIRPNGTVRDTVVYSMIAAEWPTAREGLLDRLSR